MAETHWCVECDVPFDGECCPTCGTRPLSFTTADHAEAATKQLKDLLSAIKVWQNATESRCRRLSTRESSDSMLAPDRALIEAAHEIEERLR